MDFSPFRNILSAGKETSIEVFEWERKDIIQARLKNSPSWSDYATRRNQLKLTGIRLAHSVVKADFLQNRNFLFPSLGFVLQADQIIDFGSTSNLRLMHGASTILGDVSQSSLAGRIGQGLSILFAEERGYSFCGHLESHPSLRPHSPGTKQSRTADFLFENSAKDRMVLESKAGFSLQTNDCSSVKKVLKPALQQQVQPTMARLSPSPSKGFAVYSCLRETGNPTPSALIFVDPPEQRGGNPFEIPQDWVTRHNYAGWMSLMGLHRAASRLRLAEGSHEGVGEHFAIIKVGDYDIAVPSRVVDRVPRSWGYPYGYPTVGIEVDALASISDALKGDREALLRYKPLETEKFRKKQTKSIMSDGTFFGFLNDREFLTSPIRFGDY